MPWNVSNNSNCFACEGYIHNLPDFLRIEPLVINRAVEVCLTSASIQPYPNEKPLIFVEDIPIFLFSSIFAAASLVFYWP